MLPLQKSANLLNCAHWFVKVIIPNRRAGMLDVRDWGTSRLASPVPWKGPPSAAFDVFQAEVIEQRFAAVVSPHHD
jgi:hypothetical protein